MSLRLSCPRLAGLEAGKRQSRHESDLVGTAADHANEWRCHFTSATNTDRLTGDRVCRPVADKGRVNQPQCPVNPPAQPETRA